VEGVDAAGIIDPAKLTLADKWILASMNDSIKRVTDSLAVYRFNDAASELYDFIWHKYCDWYLEMAKLSTDKETTGKVLIKVLSTSLKLLHPFMPFLTEAIWQNIPGKDSKWIMTSAWPVADEKFSSPQAIESMDKLTGVITAIRNTRAFWNIEHKARIEVLLNTPQAAEKAMIEENAKYIRQLAGSDIREIGPSVVRPPQSVAMLACGINLFVPLGGAIDLEKEKKRISLKVDDMQRYLDSINKKLSNESFVANAPEDVVAKEKDKRANFEDQIRTLKDNLRAIS
jgi:valyl-tRNA synthetase